MFSGIGGFELALLNKGHEVVGGCEIDRYAREIYHKRFPTIPVWRDATKLNAEEIPDFDLLAAGFPCQAFSIAGKRLGFEESRGTLFFEIARIARQKRPRYLLLENVKGLLSHDNGRTFANILATLDEFGYNAEWQVLNSKYFVPQNRERIFIIGYLREKSAPQVFPIVEDCEINNPAQREARGKGKRIRGAYSRAIQTSPNKGTATLIRTLDANYYKGGAHGSLIRTGSFSKNGYTQMSTVYDSQGLFPTLSHGPHGWANGFIEEPKLFAVATRNLNRNGTLINKDRTGAITRSIDNGISDGTNIRRLTPVECERLQGFPDNWTEGLSDTQRYKCLGNAVTVPVVEFIVGRIK